jgi:hypothetical protein
MITQAECLSKIFTRSSVLAQNVIIITDTLISNGKTGI